MQYITQELLKNPSQPLLIAQVVSIKKWDAFLINPFYSCSAVSWEKNQQTKAQKVSGKKCKKSVAFLNPKISEARACSSQNTAAEVNTAIVFYRKSSNPLILMACYDDPRRQYLQNWKPGKST